MNKLLEETAEAEQKNIASATSQEFAEHAPPLEYEELPARKAETTLKVTLVRQKSRKTGLIAFIALAAFAGIGVTAYSLGAYESIGVYAGLGIKNITEPPAGAKAPAFSPIDPADFSAEADGNFIIVPDETGLELPLFENGTQAAPVPQNHHTQIPNVSSFFTRAAQDESYVYFLQGPPAGKYMLYSLMRVNISTGKAEPVSNADEGEGSIYSFALHGQNIITCEHNQATDSFAFYRTPKSGEHAQLLFETDSPAFMNVFDNKIFMLFVDEQALGVFDLKTDSQPSYIALESLGDAAHYFPQFSVIDGYLYYGVWYETDSDADTEAETDTDADGQTQMEYLRRSLYTGETVSLLSCDVGGAIWNPCWDTDGGAYYAQYDSEAMEFALVSVKDDADPQIISTFEHDGAWPLIAFKDEFLVAALSPNGLRKYSPGSFEVISEAFAEPIPFAATKDFLVADNGIYRLFDFRFVPFN